MADSADWLIPPMELLTAFGFCFSLSCTLYSVSLIIGRKQPPQFRRETK